MHRDDAAVLLELVESLIERVEARVTAALVSAGQQQLPSSLASE